MPAKIRVASLIALAFASACSDDNSGWMQLPTPKGSSVQFAKRVYTDGGYADQPFKLRVIKTGNAGITYPILTSSQCKNVKLVQDYGNVYIFYEEIVLEDFSSLHGAGLPRVNLCDLHNPMCRGMLDHLKRLSVVITDLCTYI